MAQDTENSVRTIQVKPEILMKTKFGYIFIELGSFSICRIAHANTIVGTSTAGGGNQLNLAGVTLHS